MEPLPSRSHRPVLSQPHGVDHALNWDPEFLRSPKALALSAGRILLAIFGSSAVSFVLDARMWVVALVAAGAAITVVIVEILRIRRTILRRTPADDGRDFRPMSSVPRDSY